MPAKNATVKIPAVAVEHDVIIQFPGGREWVLQYRNYEGDPKTGRGASVDLLLDDHYPVHNWIGTEMNPARKEKAQHIRRADQLCIIL